MPQFITILYAILIICCRQFLLNAHDCNKTLPELANSQHLFLHCVTVNSVPVTMCLGCKIQYEDMLHIYDKFSLACNATYFNKDRLNIVPTTEALLTGLWSKAYCDDCFNNNNIFTFENKSKDFYGCLANHQADPCNKCRIEYMLLNDFYISLDRHNDGEVCFDIQDSMNHTRYKWSKELQCCRREYNVLFFSIVLATTTCVILMFYCSTYLITKRQERNHGILNDEDPLFNSTSSSSSAANVAQLNINSNQRQTDRILPNNEDNNIAPSTSQACENNKVGKVVEDTDDSSDDEPLIHSSSNAKEKLK